LSYETLLLFRCEINTFLQYKQNFYFIQDSIIFAAQFVTKITVFSNTYKSTL